jgi:hypothetical protein
VIEKDRGLRRRESDRRNQACSRPAAFARYLNSPWSCPLFSLQITDVIASDEDPTWCVNIKRGIVSLLQVQRPSVWRHDHKYTTKETDVTGICHGHYSVAMHDSAAVVRKERAMPVDCELHAVHHGDTPDADRHVLTSKTTGKLSTSHRFAMDKGVPQDLERVDFEHSHESNVHGDPNEVSSSSSRGYLR